MSCTLCILYYNIDKTLKMTSEDEVFNELYNQKASVPTVEQVMTYISSKNTDINISNFFDHLDETNIKKKIKKIKKHISTLDYQVPLYDIMTENLFLIHRDSVYNRVVYQHFRFPDSDLFNEFNETRNKLKNTINKKDKLAMRRFNKLQLMIKFLRYFDLETLENTYVRVFYFYSNEVGKNITVCKRPSYLPHFLHINPYYTRTEIINLSLNLGLIKSDSVYYDRIKLSNLCNQVKQEDIDAETLLKHQLHIIRENKVGLIQYYSLQGSYFMNQYMRNQINYKYKNEYLEDLIKSMWLTINAAPAFDKSYITYRFIKTDVHLQSLQIGDVYIEPGFTSTTRDPFYRSDIFKFGFILVRIKIPAGITGVALCMETLSHFPHEQEILFSPLSMFKLESRDEKTIYYHTDYNYADQIKTRYELTFVGKRSINFVDRPIYPNKTELVDFLKINKINSLTLDERIRYFINKFVNPMFQFNAEIGNKIYLLNVEWYDSSSVYKNFYAAQVKNGFSIYTIFNNYILFMIEIGSNNEVPYMYVNYYVKYSTIDRNVVLGDINFIRFLSSIAHYFEIPSVVIYADYLSCDFPFMGSRTLERQRGFSNVAVSSKDQAEMVLLGGSYCVDFYRYFKNNTKRYSDINVLNIEMKPKFSYDDLEKLKISNPEIVLKREDRDIIYQLYIKYYKENVKAEKDNLAELYMWIIENYCYLIDIFIGKLDKLYLTDNPFTQNDYYILDPSAYLYNRKLIKVYPEYIMNRTFMSPIKRDIINVPKNEHRIQNTGTQR